MGFVVSVSGGAGEIAIPRVFAAFVAQKQIQSDGTAIKKTRPILDGVVGSFM